jgi:hypothetical protein
VGEFCEFVFIQLSVNARLPSGVVSFPDTYVCIAQIRVVSDRLYLALAGAILADEAERFFDSFKRLPSVTSSSETIACIRHRFSRSNKADTHSFIERLAIGVAPRYSRRRKRPLQPTAAQSRDALSSSHRAELEKRALLADTLARVGLARALLCHVCSRTASNPAP